MKVWIVSLEWNFPPSEVTGDTGIVGVFAKEKDARAAQQATRVEYDAGVGGSIVYHFSMRPGRYCIACGAEAEQHDGGHECSNPDADDFCDQCGGELNANKVCDNDHDEWEIDVHCTEHPVQRVPTSARRTRPLIHFAARTDAGETVHAGPAICKAGVAKRTENDQYVTGIFNDVTCKNCIRIVRADVRREEAVEG